MCSLQQVAASSGCDVAMISEVIREEVDKVLTASRGPDLGEGKRLKRERRGKKVFKRAKKRRVTVGAKANFEAASVTEHAGKHCSTEKASEELGSNSEEGNTTEEVIQHFLTIEKNEKDLREEEAKEIAEKQRLENMSGAEYFRQRQEELIRCEERLEDEATASEDKTASEIQNDSVYQPMDQDDPLCIDASVEVGGAPETRKYRTRSQLQDKSVSLDTEPAYLGMRKCQVCPYETKYAGQMAEHSESHAERIRSAASDESKSYKCAKSGCGYVTNCIKDMFSHKGNCTVSLDNSAMPKVVDKAAQGVSSGKIEKSDKCDFETVKRCNMMRHKRNNHGNTKLKCDDCDYETPRRDTLLIHRRSKHVPPIKQAHIPPANELLLANTDTPVSAESKEDNDFKVCKSGCGYATKSTRNMHSHKSKCAVSRDSGQPRHDTSTTVMTEVVKRAKDEQSLVDAMIVKRGDVFPLAQSPELPTCSVCHYTNSNVHYVRAHVRNSHIEEGNKNQTDLENKKSPEQAVTDPLVADNSRDDNDFKFCKSGCGYVTKSMSNMHNHKVKCAVSRNSGQPHDTSESSGSSVVEKPDLESVIDPYTNGNLMEGVTHKSIKEHQKALLPKQPVSIINTAEGVPTTTIQAMSEMESVESGGDGNQDLEEATDQSGNISGDNGNKATTTMSSQQPEQKYDEQVEHHFASPAKKMGTAVTDSSKMYKCAKSECGYITNSIKHMFLHKDKCVAILDSSSQQNNPTRTPIAVTAPMANPGPTSVREKDVRQCVLCFKIVGDKMSMKNHILNHYKSYLMPLLPKKGKWVNKMPYKCSYCNADLHYEKNLLWHYAFTHNHIMMYTNEHELEGKIVNKATEQASTSVSTLPPSSITTTYDTNESTTASGSGTKIPTSKPSKGLRTIPFQDVSPSSSDAFIKSDSTVQSPQPCKFGASIEAAAVDASSVQANQFDTVMLREVPSNECDQSATTNPSEVPPSNQLSPETLHTLNITTSTNDTNEMLLNALFNSNVPVTLQLQMQGSDGCVQQVPVELKMPETDGTPLVVSKESLAFPSPKLESMAAATPVSHPEEVAKNNSNIGAKMAEGNSEQFISTNCPKHKECSYGGCCDNGGYKCPYCDQRFTKGEGFLQHLNGKTRRQCLLCPKVTNSVQGMKTHVLDHYKGYLAPSLPNEKPYKCPDCGIDKGEKYKLLRHYGFAHKAIHKYSNDKELEGKPVLKVIPCRVQMPVPIASPFKDDNKNAKVPKQMTKDNSKSYKCAKSGCGHITRSIKDMVSHKENCTITLDSGQLQRGNSEMPKVVTEAARGLEASPAIIDKLEPVSTEYECEKSSGLKQLPVAEDKLRNVKAGDLVVHQSEGDEYACTVCIFSSNRFYSVVDHVKMVHWSAIERAKKEQPTVNSFILSSDNGVLTCSLCKCSYSATAIGHRDISKHIREAHTAEVQDVYQNITAPLAEDSNLSSDQPQIKGAIPKMNEVEKSSRIKQFPVGKDKLERAKMELQAVNRLMSSDNGVLTCSLCKCSFSATSIGLSDIRKHIGETHPAEVQNAYKNIQAIIGAALAEDSNESSYQSSIEGVISEEESSDLKQFPIEEDRSYKVEEDNLVMEQKIIAGEPDFKCNHCEFETSEESKLRNHLKREHHNPEAMRKYYHPISPQGFKCNMCDRVTLRKANMKSHIKAIHYKLRDYKCSICNYASSRTNYFAKHMKEKHGKIISFKWGPKKDPNEKSRRKEATTDKDNESNHDLIPSDKGDKSPVKARETSSLPPKTVPTTEVTRLLKSLSPMPPNETPTLVQEDHEKLQQLHQDPFKEQGQTWNEEVQDQQSDLAMNEFASEEEMNGDSIQSDPVSTANNERSCNPEEKRKEYHSIVAPYCPGGRTWPTWPHAFKCNMCEHVATRKENMESHLKAVHYKIRDYKCSLCSWATSRTYYFTKHMKEKHDKFFSVKRGAKKDHHHGGEKKSRRNKATTDIDNEVKTSESNNVPIQSDKEAKSPVKACENSSMQVKTAPTNELTRLLQSLTPMPPNASPTLVQENHENFLELQKDPFQEQGQKRDEEVQYLQLGDSDFTMNEFASEEQMNNDFIQTFVPVSEPVSTAETEMNPIICETREFTFDEL